MKFNVFEYNMVYINIIPYVYALSPRIREPWDLGIYHIVLNYGLSYINVWSYLFGGS